jgi:hypothetical protein
MLRVATIVVMLAAVPVMAQPLSGGLAMGKSKISRCARNDKENVASDQWERDSYQRPVTSVQFLLAGYCLLVPSTGYRQLYTCLFLFKRGRLYP